MKEDVKDHNLRLLEELVKRIKVALDKKQDTVLGVQIEIKKGEIKTISWNVDFTVDFV